MDSKRFLEIARDACDFNGDDDYRVRRYSGRGMNGKQCVAIAVSRSGHEMHLAARMLNAEGVHVIERDELEEEFAGTRRDSMGLDSIVYWPKVQWPADEPESDEDDI